MGTAVNEARGSVAAGIHNKLCQRRGLITSNNHKKRDPRAPVLQPVPWESVQPLPGSQVASFRNHPAGQHLLAAWDTSDIKHRCQLIRILAKYKGEAQTVAVKISRCSRLHVAISPAEVAILSRVQGHENVISLRDYFFSPFFVVLVLEMLDEDLWHTLSRRSPCGGLQPATALRVTSLVSHGVAHLHHLGIIHRDLHARNILLSFSRRWRPGSVIGTDDVVRVCVTDLGQSCDVHGDLPFQARSASRGANAIIPPECMLRNTRQKVAYDMPVDVWAVGVNLVLMVKGVMSLPHFGGRTEYLQFWTGVLGCWSSQVARRLGWRIEDFAFVPPRQQGGLQPVAGGAPVTVYREILKFDPHVRPSAESLDSVFANFVPV